MQHKPGLKNIDSIHVVIDHVCKNNDGSICLTENHSYRYCKNCTGIEGSIIQKKYSDKVFAEIIKKREKNDQK